MKANRTILLLVCAMVVVPSGALMAQTPEDGQEVRPVAEERSRFGMAVKGGYHTFWGWGILGGDGVEYGRPSLKASDLAGLCGELDVDYFFRKNIVFTATVGGYGGRSGKQNMEVIAGYGLLTAKLQRTTRYADYYVGAGLGAYVARMEADDTAWTVQPGVHGIIGMRIFLTPRWSLLVEDRVALTVRALGGFGKMDLGGNFVLLGTAYRF